MSEFNWPSKKIKMEGDDLIVKYHGKVGFVTFQEVTPGVDVENPVEREYFGDVIRTIKRWGNDQQVNPNLTVNNQISIVADPYAQDNLAAIRYATWLGARWEITSVDIQYPRLVLSIGGVYNGPTPGFTDGTGNVNGYMCDC